MAQIMGVALSDAISDGYIDTKAFIDLFGHVFLEACFLVHAQPVQPFYMQGLGY